jgi:hypothetical protein
VTIASSSLELLGMQRLLLELLGDGAHDGRVTVAEHVDAVATETVDELPPVDVFEGRAVVGPLDRGVVRGHRLPVVEDAGIHELREVAHAVGHHGILLDRRELALLDEVESVPGVPHSVAAGLLVHGSPYCQRLAGASFGIFRWMVI